MEHKTFFGKLLAGDFTGAWQDIKNFVKKIWEDADHKAIDASITITEFIKNALDNSEVNILVALTPTKTDDEVLAFMKENAVKVLSNEMLLKEITPESSADEIQQTLNKIIDTYGGLNDEDKQQLFTSIAANLYRLYLDIKAGKKVTFGTSAVLVESGFKAGGVRPPKPH